MYEHLKGKTLMVMDRTSLAACAVIRAKEMGIRTVVANFYKTEDSPSKQVADVAIDIDISDTDAMLKLIEEYHIDGIFVGWTDSHLPFYANICEKAGLPCCGTTEQFDILSNDKRRFKEECLKYGVPTPEIYKIDIDFKREDLDKIVYPVMVKPADGSGGRGIKKCNNEEELIEHYKELYDSSASKKIVCERYIQSENEIFIHYTVQDGFPSLSSSFLKYKVDVEKSKAASCLFHMFSPRFLEEYKRDTEPAVIKMIQGLGVRYGNVMFQGFEENGKLYFHESGLRMGGEQFYVFAERLNGISSLELMIEFALTGKMTLYDVKTQDNYKFSKYCCNYYIPLKPGRITRIEGVDEINAMPQLLQNRQFKFIGDEISSTSSLDRVIFRLHVMDDTKEAFAKTLCKISDTVKIYDQDGNDMQLQKLEYDTVLNMIEDAWLDC
ncbi:MAG: hypothetical protein J6L23_02160 [Clostridia bacterium]|nr:hypothetical protein [Clostridia bacterium]MBQ6906480.1 hypothetical protein [Clostridia bacterium]